VNVIWLPVSRLAETDSGPRGRLLNDFAAGIGAKGVTYQGFSPCFRGALNVGRALSEMMMTGWRCRRLEDGGCTGGNDAVQAAPQMTAITFK
jgi:hypothetical protein